MRVNIMLLATQSRKVSLALLVALCALAAVSVRAQTTAKETKEASTIAGRVTADGHGVAGVLVTLMPTQLTTDRKPAAKAKSDADGRYLLTDVPPGSYYLNPT